MYIYIDIYLCKTTWIEKYKGVTNFLHNLIKLIIGLTEITSWIHFQTSEKTKTLVGTHCDNVFIIALFSLAFLLSYAYLVNKMFQKKGLDLNMVANTIKNIIQVVFKM